MAVDGKFSMYRPSDPEGAGRKALADAWDLHRVMTDKTRYFGGADIRLLDGRLIRIPESEASLPDLPAGVGIEYFLIEYLCDDKDSTSWEEYGISRFVTGYCVPKYEGWDPAIDYFSFSTPAGGFDTIGEAIRFLDGCIGNIVDQLRPRFLVSSKNGRYQPTYDEVQLGIPTKTIPAVGAFPRSLVEKHSPAFWEDVRKAIRYPTLGFEPDDPEEDTSWVRKFSDGSFMYRIASKRAEQDPRLVKLLSSELGVKADAI